MSAASRIGRRALLPWALLSAGGLGACDGSMTPRASRETARVVAESPGPAFTPAPCCALARLLGADATGHGDYRLDDDGPWCGFAARVDRSKPLGTPRTVSATHPMAPVESGAVGFFQTRTTPLDGRASSDDAAPLELVLNGPGRVAVDESLELERGLTLVNTSSRPIRYVKALDGSFEHWRSPFVDVYAREERSGHAYRWAHGNSYERCGSTNELRLRDTVLLAPHAKTTAPFGGWSVATIGASLPGPGRYSVWVVYAACAGPEYGHPLGAGEDIPGEVFEGTIASNAVMLEVVARK